MNRNERAEFHEALQQDPDYLFARQGERGKVYIFKGRQVVGSTAARAYLAELQKSRRTREQ